MSVPGQREFDHLVQDIVQQGGELADAVQEVLAIFNDSSIDTQGLYLYSCLSELEEKQKTEKRITTLENCATKKDSFVNASFAMQGLMQTLQRNDKHAKGALILLENRKVFHSLLAIIFNLATQDDDSDANSKAEDSSDDEGDEKVLQTKRSLEFSLTILRRRPTDYRNFYEMIVLSIEEMIAFKVLLDSSSEDAAWVNDDKYLTLT